jgi:hypothetical protein
MHSSLPNKSPGNEAKVNWKRKPFASGHDISTSPGNVNYFRIFLLLVAIHTSIFIIPSYPAAGIVLLLSLIRGWMNGL